VINTYLPRILHCFRDIAFDGPKSLYFPTGYTESPTDPPIHRPPTSPPAEPAAGWWVGAVAAPNHQPAAGSASIFAPIYAY